MPKFLILFLFTGLLQACSAKKDNISGQLPESQMKAKFTLISPEESGVYFSNYADTFKEDYIYTIFIYEFMYNGGGVAAGDVNGDSLPDLYFTATFDPDKLYINLGDFRFLDVTDLSGVGAEVGYKSGTVMADINGDGRLDIYVCRSSNSDDGQKTNHTFINMGNRKVNGINVPIFEDQSKKLGLDDNSNSVHACFFDYDLDNDLDLFILNHRLDVSKSSSLNLQQASNGSVTRVTTPLTPFESNRFYRNDNGHFVDETVKAHLVSSAFGMSATVADINLDGWMDIYVANDYIEPDMIYINNKNGTFTDKYSEYLKHSSQSSMGSDIADINNDGYDDIMVLDMKPDDPVRYKLLSNGMEYDRFNLLVKYGYGRQDGRNVLQLNNGNNTFSEIGQFAGVAATDWSWGALIADYDNDGWKDIYVSNGYRRDITNRDYENFSRDSLEKTGGINQTRFPDLGAVLKIIPEQKSQNTLFINTHKLGFVNATRSAGMNIPSFSNGSAFADLDRDGDLDLIVNNIQQPAFIYRNDISGNHWFEIDIHLNNKNTNGIGTLVDLYAGGIHQHQTLMTNKGFFSSSEPILHFGLGDVSLIDSILLRWPDGSKEILRSLHPDRRLIWETGTGEVYTDQKKAPSDFLFKKVDVFSGWRHAENEFVDFKREKLLPYMLSVEGPCMATADVNGDSLEDIYIGNGSGFPKVLFLQNPDNSFTQSLNPVFTRDSMFEDCGSTLEDFDGDGDKDLIVISGGNAFGVNDAGYMSRYYLNDGKGTFSRSIDFPVIRTNAGAILSLDFDHDKDLDIIIAGRSTPGRYPESPRSYLLRNNKGKFTDVTYEFFPALKDLGMISDMKAGDLDGDHNPEIVFVGDWMPITVYSFDQKTFKNRTAVFGLEKTTGWWKSVMLADMDDDGDLDLMAGNIGLNNRLNTSEEQPITLITKDFDGNGSLDPILCFYFNDKLYPYAGRDAMIAQIPMIKKKFVRYTPYASATINDIFTSDERKGSTTLTANTFQTSYLMNENKKFIAHALPFQVQLAPVFDMVVEDFNNDGTKDILMAGNFIYSETETGEMDAGNGTLLLQNQDGTFDYIPNIVNGFWAQDEVRELKIIALSSGKRAIVTGNNKGLVQLHTLHQAIPTEE